MPHNDRTSLLVYFEFFWFVPVSAQNVWRRITLVEIDGIKGPRCAFLVVWRVIPVVKPIFGPMLMNKGMEMECGVVALQMSEIALGFSRVVQQIAAAYTPCCFAAPFSFQFVCPHGFFLSSFGWLKEEKKQPPISSIALMKQKKQGKKEQER
jgi:hypothetical protein